MTSIAVIGGGKIGEALIAGLVAGEVSPTDITVSNRRPERGAELRERYGVSETLSNVEAVTAADVVFLTVKPALVPSIAADIAEALEDHDEPPIVVSMAAGVTIDCLEDCFSAGTPVIRVMPNTPMLVRHAVCALAPSRFCTQEQLDVVTDLLERVGTVVRVEESHMDAVVALSGSSPAYFFLIAEALIDAGVYLGLPRTIAEELVAGSMGGSAALLQESEKSACELRVQVSSPGGTTVAAVRELEESGVRGALYRAAKACADRNHELGVQGASHKL